MDIDPDEVTEISFFIHDRAVHKEELSHDSYVNTENIVSKSTMPTACQFTPTSNQNLEAKDSVYFRR